MEQKPTVGRVIHYTSFGTPDGEFEPECRAAIVTAVPEVVGNTAHDKGYVVSLCVLNPTGMYFLAEAWQSDSHAGGTWHWPERV